VGVGVGPPLPIVTVPDWYVPDKIPPIAFDMLWPVGVDPKLTVEGPDGAPAITSNRTFSIRLVPPA
jgi:hypothetical protein